MDKRNQRAEADRRTSRATLNLHLPARLRGVVHRHLARHPLLDGHVELIGSISGNPSDSLTDAHVVVTSKVPESGDQRPLGDNRRMIVILSECDRETLAALHAPEVARLLRGVILEDDPLDELVRTVKAVMEGAVRFSERAWAVLMRRPAADRLRTVLTRVEFEVLNLVVKGHTDTEIAAIRTVTVTTVRHHMRNLRRKMGCTNRHQLIALAYQSGLTTPPTA